MSKITIYNYEAYLLDSMEGNLSVESTSELLLFFENHPELKEDGFELITLQPHSKIYTEKEKLKKGAVNESNYEDFLIAEVENENDAVTKIALNGFLKNNPKKQREFDFYQKTKLVAPTIFFEEKKSLKKKERKIIPLYWWMSSAAAIILAIFLLRGVFEQKDAPELKMVETQPAKLKPNKAEETQVIEQEANLVVEIKKEPKKSQIKIKEQQVEEVKDVVIEKELIAEKEDTITLSKEVEEPVLLADNVKITFEEDDFIAANNTPTTRPEKKKKGLFKKIFNSQIRDKVREKVMRKEVNQNGEIVAYALVVGGVNLYRKELNKKDVTN